jgi:hypothetical protein
MDANAAAGSEQRRVIWDGHATGSCPAVSTREGQPCGWSPADSSGRLAVRAADPACSSSCRPAKRYQLDGGRLTVGASRCAEERYLGTRLSRPYPPKEHRRDGAMYARPPVLVFWKASIHPRCTATMRPSGTQMRAYSLQPRPTTRHARRRTAMLAHTQASQGRRQSLTARIAIPAKATA